MKQYKTFLCTIFIFCFISCITEPKEMTSLEIDVENVEFIGIENRVHCSFFKLNKKEATIRDRKEIKKIISTFSYMEPIENRGSISLNMSYGFFDVKFKEGDIKHYYSIIYTVYDGVVIWSNDGGKLFKNDRLEVVVSKYLE